MGRVREYWVVNAKSRTTLVHREPEADCGYVTDTKAVLPSDAPPAAGAIVVTDEADGATRIFLDGLSWRGVPDRPIVT